MNEAKHKVTVNLFNKACDDNTKQLVGVKTFHIDTSVRSKSLGYMIGYVQCMNDNGLFTEFEQDYWDIHGSYPPDDYDASDPKWAEVNI